jgi:hypothetical protein
MNTKLLTRRSFLTQAGTLVALPFGASLLKGAAVPLVQPRGKAEIYSALGIDPAKAGCGIVAEQPHQNPPS